MPSPANGHSAYINSSYPHGAYSYNQPPAPPYYSQSIQPAFTQARMYAPTAQHPVYSPVATSSFDARNASYPSLLAQAGHPYARPQQQQQDGSRQSSIEPQNAAQAYSYHTQRQHSAASLHSDYSRGTPSTQSPPMSRRLSPPGLLDPSASASAPNIALRASQLLPSPITTSGAQAQGYSSYLAQHAAQQRAFSDSYASQHSQSQRLYDNERFMPAAPATAAQQQPAQPTATAAARTRAFEDELSNSGSEASVAPPTHTYTPIQHAQVPRYQTSPLEEKVNSSQLAGLSKEIPAGNDWAAERRAW